jgi:lysyl-tRNA synthetase class 2
MLEFYQAYATYDDLMVITEEMFTFIARELLGSLTFSYQETEIDLTPPWPRITLKDAIIRYGKISSDVVDDPASW